MTRRQPLATGAIAALLVLCIGACTQQNVSADAPAKADSASAKFWGDFPSNCDPKTVGKRVALNFIERPDEMAKPATAAAATEPAKPTYMHYWVSCTLYGSLKFAAETGDKNLQDQIVKRYERIKTEKVYWPNPTNVDSSVFGIVPFEFYMRTGDPAYLAIGKRSADAQWDSTKKLPDGVPDGLSYQTRYWIDDMFMIIGLQVQAYRATKDHVYLDHAAKEMASYLEKLQQPNGLFFHGQGSDHYWGRGNGWVAVGMAEILSELPQNHPDRPKIVEGYKKMMAALKKFQAADGSWHQLIDDEKIPTDPTRASWPESSCTAMFTFGVAMGVRNGWLDDSYKETARKGWIATCSFLDDKANMKEVCIGTNKKAEVQYYYDRPREVGNLHGQAACIWAARAMLEPAK